jgi:hypothetical protein
VWAFGARESGGLKSTYGRAYVSPYGAAEAAGAEEIWVAPGKGEANQKGQRKHFTSQRLSILRDTPTSCAPTSAWTSAEVPALL